MSAKPWTRRALAAHLRDLGLAEGDSVLVHAGLRSVGPMLNGPDDLIGALSDVLGPAGTLLAYADWQARDEDHQDPALRQDVAPFDAATSRASRDNGAFPELVRAIPGALRSASPGASCVALGGQAGWFVADHALNYGYGPRSPFGKLVVAGGKTLLVGAPLDTMTLLHHAEHLADIPGKRVKRYQVPLRDATGALVWVEVEEFDTSDPVVEGLADDYFGEIVAAFLAGGQGRRGLIGAAESVLVEAPAMVEFGVRWLEERAAVRP